MPPSLHTPVPPVGQLAGPFRGPGSGRPWRHPRALTALWALGHRLRRNMACQDWVIVAFHLYMCLRVQLAPPSTLSGVARSFTLGLCVATLMIVVATRGELLRERNVRVPIYRVGLLTTGLMSYLGLRHHLAALAPELLDASLLALDQRVFGATPAAALDRFVGPRSVEWFAFFYYLHFFVLALHAIGGVVLDRGRRRYELLFGAQLVACVGHAVYTLVPGLGPYAAFPELFQHTLRGGVFWHQVQQTVSVAGAQLDIFPSLHTAFPVFFTLHAIRHRRSLPFRLTWLPMLLVTLNIVVATVFLRWHYGVDVVAGIALAVLAQRVPVVLWKREQARIARGGQAVWEPCEAAVSN